jgi:hypothetical protein
MKTQLFASALLVASLSPAALAQSSSQENQASDQPSGAAQAARTPEALPQELQQRLTSAGFSDVKVVPRSFVVSAKDKNGRQVLMHITPTSTMIMTEVPIGRLTTGAGGSSTGNMGNGGMGNGGQNPGTSGQGSETPGNSDQEPSNSGQPPGNPDQGK